jgi:hypothetical protein
MDSLRTGRVWISRMMWSVHIPSIDGSEREGVTGYTKLNVLTVVRSSHTAFAFCIYLRTNSDLCHLHKKTDRFL